MEIHPFNNFLYVVGTGVWQGKMLPVPQEIPQENFKTSAIRQKRNFKSCVRTDEGFHENPLD